MTFVLAFSGSRGDVQPAVALGVALAGAGHAVRLAVPPNLVEFGRGAGLDTHPYGADTGELLGSELVRRQLKSANPRTRLRAIAELTLRDGRRTQRELAELATGADVLIGGSAGQERALNVATALGIPYLPVHYCPLRRNGVVSLLPVDGLPPAVHRAGWAALEQLLWLGIRGAELTLAADLGLPPPVGPAASRIAGVPEIQAYDPLLFPGLAEEWGPARPLTGFLGLAPETRALVDPATDDDGLDAWLAAGPPPLYVGFGSMTVADPAELAGTLARVTAELGLRVLVAAGWGGLDGTGFAAHGDRIRVVRSVDHAVVLPRCVALVHHGGAGTVAAGLRAGRPALICWHGADQPLWGRRLRALGAGTAIPVAGLTPERLQSALVDVLRPERAAAAARAAAALIPPAAAAERAVRIAERVAEVATRRSRGDAVQAGTLSVVVPAYNEEEVIGECLDRLTAQLGAITEIVVVDNNSTDKTADIVRGYAERFPQVVLVREERQGLVHARNRGLDAAHGALRARIDADTRIPEHWAATVVEFFAADTAGHWAAACGRGEAYGLPYGDRVGRAKKRLRERDPDGVKQVPVLYGSNMILRAETWAAIRGSVAMRRDVFEDVDMGLCVTEIGGRNAFLNNLTVGVAARRMETGIPAFVRYMACLPRTLLLHRRWGLAAGAVLVYVPSIVVLHAARLLLIRAYDRRTGTYGLRNMLRRAEKHADRPAP
ncbi:glycosyltransferase [Nocardia jiangsuensis]|uniref:Glycosyltransferase n=1 Tax=Nocardia jiangsuensis TaxID=1691563 RepID=A0ABV8DLV5_9NOCA